MQRVIDLLKAGQMIRLIDGRYHTVGSDGFVDETDLSNAVAAGYGELVIISGFQFVRAKQYPPPEDAEPIQG